MSRVCGCSPLPAPAGAPSCVPDALYGLCPPWTAPERQPARSRGRFGWRCAERAAMRSTAG